MFSAAEILYTLFIFPLEQIIDLCFHLSYRIFRNPALSVGAISVAVSTLTLPLYLLAEGLQNQERDLQRQMKDEVATLRQVFKGDEGYLRLSVYYRQRGYHPLYALRSSASILIQVPFFIAAFSFLSNLSILQGQNLGPIANLAAPDGLLSLGALRLNLLPITMTLINVASAAIYTRGLGARDRVQLYGMAGVFLVLLYNSPAALVLYWTGNNVYSLVKNVIAKTRQPRAISWALVAAAAILVTAYVLFFHQGEMGKRIITAALLMAVPLLPLVGKGIIWLKGRLKFTLPAGLRYEGIFFLSITGIFLLSGFVIPSALIATGVQQFSFIESYRSPFPFIIITTLQALGFFVIYPALIFYLVPKNYRPLFSVVSASLLFIALVNVFLFPGNYGHLTLLFQFSEPVRSPLGAALGNLAICGGIVLVVLGGFFYVQRVVHFALVSTLSAFVILGSISCYNINQDFRAFEEQLVYETLNARTEDKIFRFSRTGKNILVIHLDRAIGGYVPFIFEEDPSLHEAFDGFTWYPNTISFGGYTVFGAPGVFGGYEYTPLEMQKRQDVPLVEKHNEALLLLPRIFSEQGFLVTVTDPPFANYSYVPDLRIFEKYQEIRAENIIGKYTEEWLIENDEIVALNYSDFICETLIRFSFFRTVPSLFRNFVYSQGNWLKTTNSIFGFSVDTHNTGISMQTLHNYITLEMLPYITDVIDDEIHIYNVMHNDLPHEPAFLFYPGYTLSSMITQRGHGPFANDNHYHVNMASFLLLGKWFGYLRNAGVYDNTRIIIASDHGWSIQNDLLSPISFTDGLNIQNFNALL
ncbi:MAG: YidC/Oxa1 family membrane protein insertase [Treponema sp.]|nr:YidC/Oxa1 family membrane protein insertase [Treponema sp.]